MFREAGNIITIAAKIRLEARLKPFPCVDAFYASDEPTLRKLVIVSTSSRVIQWVLKISVLVSHYSVKECMG